MLVGSQSGAARAAPGVPQVDEYHLPFVWSHDGVEEVAVGFGYGGKLCLYFLKRFECCFLALFQCIGIEGCRGTGEAGKVAFGELAAFGFGICLDKSAYFGRLGAFYSAFFPVCLAGVASVGEDAPGLTGT